MALSRAGQWTWAIATNGTLSISFRFIGTRFFSFLRERKLSTDIFPSGTL